MELDRSTATNRMAAAIDEVMALPDAALPVAFTRVIGGLPPLLQRCHTAGELRGALVDLLVSAAAAGWAAAEEGQGS